MSAGGGAPAARGRDCGPDPGRTAPPAGRRGRSRPHGGRAVCPGRGGGCRADRRARPCQRCGAPEAGGLCGVCLVRDETEGLRGRRSPRSWPAAAVRWTPARRWPPTPRPRYAPASSAPATGSVRTTGTRCSPWSWVGWPPDPSCADAVGRRCERSAVPRRTGAEAGLGRAVAPPSLAPTAGAVEQAADAAAREARERTAEHLLAACSSAWLAAQSLAPVGEPGPQGWAAAYATGAAKARDAVVPVRRPAPHGARWVPGLVARATGRSPVAG